MPVTSAFSDNVFKRHLSQGLFTKQQILESSKLTEFADDNFRFNEDRRKFFKLVENTVHTVFQKICTADT